MTIQEKAFPNPHLTHETGMTIRDYFAAKAMQAMMSKTDFDAYYTDVAKWSYELADAMMGERNGKQ
jgi:hypothetical protein